MKSWAIVAAAFLIAGAIVFNALCNRFYIDSSTKYKVDKLTGSTYKYHDQLNEWIKIFD
jgi:hypothetical protein